MKTRPAQRKLALASASVAVHAALLASVLAPVGPIQQTTVDRQAVQVRLLPGPGRAGEASRDYFRPGSVAVASPASLLPPASSRPAVAATPPELAYLPSTMLDRRPTPISEPDIKALHDVTTSGLTVRLRIYIDRFGKVDNVVTLAASSLDQEFAAALQRMFSATAFLPGRRDGVDVPSYLEIALSGG